MDRFRWVRCVPFGSVPRAQWENFENHSALKNSRQAKRLCAVPRRVFSTDTLPRTEKLCAGLALRPLAALGAYNQGPGKAAKAGPRILRHSPKDPA
ncbi:unnamed protein product [Lota lota]